jgi:LysR family transcriptional regulator (chromosome initiation inhibitor)
MLDYKLLQALDAVATEAGFERAARTLHLTQSAVSQRVRLLEEQLGQILLVRANPPRPTPAGERLLRHFRQVALLEQDAVTELAQADLHRHGRLRLSVNADSLATWLLPPLVRLAREHDVLLDLVLADQDQTRRWLEQGEVIACVSSSDQAPAGCVAKKLGVLEYLCMAAPDYFQRWFPDGVTWTAMAQAPAVEFGPEDRSQDRFLIRQFGELPIYPRHRVPSAQAYLESIVQGLGYGMLPRLQAHALLRGGALIELIPNAPLLVPLYLHHWQLDTPLLQALSAQLMKAASVLTVTESPA